MDGEADSRKLLQTGALENGFEYLTDNLDNSSPVVSTMKQPVFVMNTGCFMYFYLFSVETSCKFWHRRFPYPSKYPLRSFYRILDKSLHPVCAGPVHLLGNVGINIQRGRRVRVAEVALHRLNIISRADSGNRVGMS